MSSPSPKHRPSAAKGGRLKGEAFDKTCQRCPRLANFLTDVRADYPDYYGLPVPAFGQKKEPVLIVGLAPGLHGANATGRPFTGDHAGILLYETLHRYGFASQAESRHRRDGLKLHGCRITNAVKCLPPANKPVGAEVNECNTFLKRDLADMASPGIVLALGSIAHNAVLKAMDMKLSSVKFGHGALHTLSPELRLLDSYHCSRYNTNTKRLTEEMFNQIFEKLRTLVDG
ncbi:MAG: uracil-DNA glycosylase [Gammaproteobacteria bacterium]